MKLVSCLYDRVSIAAEAAAGRLDAGDAEVAIVLGSGLAAVADALEGARSMPYSQIPGYPETTVAGHPGRLVSGMLGGRKVLALCGRVHGYEGYPPDEVGFGMRVAATLGVTAVIVTNVTGGIDPSLEIGEIVAISDHVNLTGGSPLRGPNDERLGPRFVDMTDTYTPALRQVAAEASKDAFGRALREAVYAGMAGPQYETPAEVRMLRTLGADVVGMSTVHEVIVARHSGLAVLGLSLVANAAAGVMAEPLRHEDVTKAAAAGANRLAALITGVLARLAPGSGA